MKVLVIHSVVAENAPPEEQDTLATSRAIADALQSAGHSAVLASFTLTAEEVRALLRKHNADVIFNMVESVLGQDGLAAAAPAIFNCLGAPFTGSSAGAMALAGDKPLAKSILCGAGLPTPDWTAPPDWRGLIDGVPYIVKSATEDASLALDDTCILDQRELVISRAEACAVRYGGRWFAEAYVDGREFNVALFEDQDGWRVLPIPEMRFEDWPRAKPRIVGYRAKWDATSVESTNTVRSFGLEDREPMLSRALRELAQEACARLGVTGYARVDFRADGGGRPMILEVNPNPCLAPDAGFAAAALQGGFSYADLIVRLAQRARR